MGSRRDSSPDPNQAKFNLQTQFTLIIQQLERLERVTESVHRANSIKRNATGDRIHVTVGDNLEGLNSKLLCLNSTINYYQNEDMTNACVAELREWYRLRTGFYSPILLKAVIDTLSACIGQFRLIARPVTLTPSEVADCEAKLAQAVRDFDVKEQRFARDPGRYLAKDRPYSVIAPHRERVDANEFSRDLIRALRNSLRDYTNP